MEKDNSIRVAVRVRQLLDSERKKGDGMSISLSPDEPQVQVSSTGTAFTYDYVFGPEADQDEVYSTAVEGMVNEIFKGYNVTILAYGQTGSGKTYSMDTNYSEGETMGIIPRFVSDIFNKISQKDDWNFKVTVSFIELYQEQVYDLLTTKPRKDAILEIREEIKKDSKGFKIVGLTEKPVNNVQDTLACLSHGSAGRATGATNINNQSSRSHAIFTIKVHQQKGDDTSTAITSEIQLVDLAGSERSKKTGTIGERFKEGVNNNKALLALTNVISTIANNNPSSHVPYRDNKLTKLLRNSLGGNAKTLMIACVSPAPNDLDESICTLKYAYQIKKIKNKPIVNQKLQDLPLVKTQKVNQTILELTQENEDQKQIILALTQEKNDLKQIILALTQENDELKQGNLELNQKLAQPTIQVNAPEINKEELSKNVESIKDMSAKILEKIEGSNNQKTRQLLRIPSDGEKAPQSFKKRTMNKETSCACSNVCGSRYCTCRQANEFCAETCTCSEPRCLNRPGRKRTVSA